MGGAVLGEEFRGFKKASPPKQNDVHGSNTLQSMPTLPRRAKPVDGVVEENENTKTLGARIRGRVPQVPLPREPCESSRQQARAKRPLSAFTLQAASDAA